MPVETRPPSVLKRRSPRTLSLAPRVVRRSSRDNDDSRPVLRFMPYAWAKLEYLRDCGPTEIGAFGVSAADDLLLVEDLVLVKQNCDVLSVIFDDAAVADFFDRQVDQGLPPERFARIWIHTHPGCSAQPSGVDEATFSRVFGRSDWAVMFIIARGGSCQCRLRFSVGPTAIQRIPVSVDYRRAFTGSDHAAWQSEYLRMVRPSSSQALEQDLPFYSESHADPWQW